MDTLTISIGVETLDPEPEVSFEKRCRHYWLIESPSGVTSKGICKICGKVREFRNYVFDFPWEDDGKGAGFPTLENDLSKELMLAP